MRLELSDPRENPKQYAAQLGLSEAAVDLYLASEVIDLHIDSFIWHRLFGYDLRRKHGRGLLGGLCYSQADIPRVLEAGITGATWVITTNPARDARGREEAFFENLDQLVSILQAVDQVQICKNERDYRLARRAGKHAAYIGVQGGNAVDRTSASLDRLASGLVLRITLVHLLSSSLGGTSSPGRLWGCPGLSARGKQFVEQLDELDIFVDLAHIDERGFWDAVHVHDKSKPLLVSHTGVSGVHEHWRNLDDRQLRAIAESGGVIGIMYHSEFLGDPLFSGSAESVVRHMEHVVTSVGPDHVALGSDWDGAICTPKNMRTCSELPVLVEIMLRRGWPSDHVQKALGLNFLRALAQLRG